MKRIKHVAKQHRKHGNSPCLEIPWGSDSRFTICDICGEQRYYPEGWHKPPPTQDKTQT